MARPVALVGRPVQQLSELLALPDCHHSVYPGDSGRDPDTPEHERRPLCAGGRRLKLRKLGQDQSCFSLADVGRTEDQRPRPAPRVDGTHRSGGRAREAPRGVPSAFGRRSTRTVGRALGETGPAAALPWVLSAVGQVLRPIQIQHAVAVDHPDSRRRLVAVLRTALAATDHDLLSDVQYDTAMGGLALAVVAPAEVAALLIERTLADLPGVIPMGWHRLLADMNFADRTPVAEAYWMQLEQQRAASRLTPSREDTAHKLLTQLGGGTEQWVALVRELATGPPRRSHPSCPDRQVLLASPRLDRGRARTPGCRTR